MEIKNKVVSLQYKIITDMISPKILRNLEKGKNYLIYDSIYEYILRRFEHGWTIAVNRRPNDTIFIFEKDLEHLQLEYRDTEHDSFYKYDYQYNGYTNRFKGLSGVGGLNIHGYFSWYDLYFFGEKKDENSIEELKQFKKVMTASNRRTKKNRYD